jgi:hypothetical protein
MKNKFKHTFDPINTRGEFYAKNPYTDEILEIVKPEDFGNFTKFDFIKYWYLDKVEIYFWDPYKSEDKRITTIYKTKFY